MSDSSFSQLFAGGPPVAAADERQPIGVPPGYSSGRRIGGEFIGVTIPLPPRYFEGDEWRPGNLDPSIVAALQADMVAAGLLKKNDYSRGAWGVESAKAYAQVLAAANGSGLDDRTMLERLKGGWTGQEEEKAKRAPLVTRLTHPDDLKALVNDVSVRTIGRYLNDDELAPFVSSFTEMQRRYQEQAYALADPEGTGGTVIETPDFEAQAQSRIRSQFPQETFEHSAKERFNGFLSLLSGVGGGSLR